MPLERARRRSRRRSRRSFGRRHHSFGNEDDLDGAHCSTVRRGTRGVIGTVAGGAIGATVTLLGFFLVTTKDRALQKAAGAPSPKPGLLTGIAGVAAAAAGGVIGNRMARKKPDC